MSVQPEGCALLFLPRWAMLRADVKDVAQS
jgi:hypothetical protein